MTPRSDGRAPRQIRPVKITTRCNIHAEGSAFIEVGDTKVICTATIENTVPSFLRGKGVGWLTAEYRMLPRSTSLRMPRESASGRIKGRTHEIQRLIGRALRAVTDLDGFGERQLIVDCDVIQADGGTRTASITGAWVALMDAVKNMRQKGRGDKNFVLDQVAAVSVGIVDGEPLLDLCYEEDSTADVDLNLVMTDQGGIVEIQGTAEAAVFSEDELTTMIDYAKGGIDELLQIQRDALKE